MLDIPISTIIGIIILCFTIAAFIVVSIFHILFIIEYCKQIKKIDSAEKQAMHTLQEDSINNQNNEYIIYDKYHVAVGKFKPLSPDFKSSGQTFTILPNKNKE